MNGLALLGIFLVLYGVFSAFIGITKRPQSIWGMGKIQGFVKVLGETGAVIFFTVWGAAALGVGIWLLAR